MRSDFTGMFTRTKNTYKKEKKWEPLFLKDLMMHIFVLSRDFAYIFFSPSLLIHCVLI